jgi:hypothetical protein
MMHVRTAARIGRRIVVPAAALAAVLVTAACGAQPAHLPPKPVRLSAPPATAAPPSQNPQQAVIAAYTAYFPASQKAQADTSPAAAQQLLARYAAQPYLGNVLSQMTAYRARGEVAAGYVIPHVMRVTVSGGTAEVYDCQDASHAALASAATGTAIPGTTGSARTYLIASLTRADGRWRLTSLAHLSLSCQPGSPSAS